MSYQKQESRDSGKFLEDLFKNELKLLEVGKDINVQFEINQSSLLQVPNCSCSN
jgi:hypothetical protein